LERGETGDWGIGLIHRGGAANAPVSWRSPRRGGEKEQSLSEFQNSQDLMREFNSENSEIL
jgi:hypothetical protein